MFCVHLSFEKLDRPNEILEWCIDQLGEPTDNWDASWVEYENPSRGLNFVFKNSDDAVRFRLIWG